LTVKVNEKEAMLSHWNRVIAPSEKVSSLSRRGIVLGAAAALSPGALHAQDISAPAALPPADQAAVDAKYANVIRKYGDRLSEAQRTRVREILVRHQRMLMRVREFSLENGDAPATGFRLYAERQP
jgi:hypothetical protein